MAFIVTEPCIKCKYTDCVDVCPVDCFREGPNFLVIDPHECIDCALCLPQCPVDAIINGYEAVGPQLQFVELNARLSRNVEWKPIIRSKDPPPDHAQWKDVSDKVHLLIFGEKSESA